MLSIIHSHKSNVCYNGPKSSLVEWNVEFFALFPKYIRNPVVSFHRIVHQILKNTNKKTLYQQMDRVTQTVILFFMVAPCILIILNPLFLQHVSGYTNHHQGAHSLCFVKVTVLISVYTCSYWSFRCCGCIFCVVPLCVYIVHCAFCTVHDIHT